MSMITFIKNGIVINFAHLSLGSLAHSLRSWAQTVNCTWKMKKKVSRGIMRWPLTRGKFNFQFPLPDRPNIVGIAARTLNSQRRSSNDEELQCCGEAKKKVQLNEKINLLIVLIASTTAAAVYNDRSFFQWVIADHLIFPLFFFELFSIYRATTTATTLFFYSLIHSLLSKVKSRKTPSRERSTTRNYLRNWQLSSINFTLLPAVLRSH